MTDREKIGPRIDADLWERFRQDVKERKGTVRGSVGDELENAIRQYLSQNNELGIDERYQRIEDKLGRIENRVGAATADGGAASCDCEHTHAPSRVEAATEDKPPANTATEKKVAYLAESLIDQEVPNTREIKSIPESAIIDLVKDEYGFRPDTAKRYVDEVAEKLSLRDHPVADGILVSEDKRDQLIAEQREQARDEADDKLEG